MGPSKPDGVLCFIFILKNKDERFNHSLSWKSLLVLYQLLYETRRELWFHKLSVIFLLRLYPIKY